ncbi:MAG: hypothetical protein QUS11_06655 [Candidatus Fermentibacter sp.]|nr:hypothetical protein [Candidatus Fermentibacter sp.]
MAVYVDDKDLESKIGLVEGEKWVRHHKQWEDMERDKWEPGKDGFCTIGGVLACRILNEDGTVDWYGTRTIYGMGGWHRYHVRQSGEVVFSTHHCGRYGAREFGEDSQKRWEELEQKIRSAGFRLSTEA